MNEKLIFRLIGGILLLFCISIFSVSAFVSEKQSNSVSIELNQAILGNIMEGQTVYYTPRNSSSLDQILFIRTVQNNVSLYFDTDLELQNDNYAIYQIVVRVGNTIPYGSNFVPNDIITILSLANPDSVSLTKLDVAGEWTFNFEIINTAKSVTSNQDTSVNFIVKA